MEANPAPTQQLNASAEVDNELQLKYRKFSGDSAITTDSESWESDADSLSEDVENDKENENEVFEKNMDNLPRLSLDSGIPDQAVKATSAVQIPQKKLRSILRAEPQVFKINESKVRRGRSKAGDNTGAPKKAVGFILPEGAKIPERAPSNLKLPVRYRAQRTLRVLKQKLKGKKHSAAQVPWRPSAHTLGKAVVTVPRARPIKVDEKFEVREPVAIKVTKFGDLKLKKLKVSEIETEEGLIIEAEEELDSGENSEEEDQEDLDLNELDRGSKGGSNKENTESNNMEKSVKSEKDKELVFNGKVSKNGIDTTGELIKNEDDEEDHFKVSRRKALRYHLKGIQVTGDIDFKPKAPAKKIPKFPIGGHGPCHAQKHYPHAQVRHINTKPVPPVEIAEKKVKDPSEKKRSPFRIHKKNSIEITKPGDISLVIDGDITDNNNKEDQTSKSALKKKPDSQPPKTQTQFEYLLNIARLIEPVPKAKPGKIVNTRYRRVPSYELFPYLA